MPDAKDIIITAFSKLINRTFLLLERSTQHFRVSKIPHVSRQAKVKVSTSLIMLIQHLLCVFTDYFFALCLSTDIKQAVH